MSDSHWSHGLYRLLEGSFGFRTLQKALAGRKARTRLVRDYLRPTAGARILDVGCGPGSLLETLPPDIEYVGFDMNPRYIETATARKDSRAKFFLARVGSAGVDEMRLPPFDFVVAKNVLHHLSDQEAESLVELACRHLKPGGVFFSSDNVFHPGQHWCSRLLISLDRGRHVRTAGGYLALLASRFTEIETALITDLLIVPYSHFIMRAVRGDGDTRGSES